GACAELTRARRPSGFRHFADPQGKRLAEGSSVNLFATKLAQRCRSTSLPFAAFRYFFRFLFINMELEPGIALNCLRAWHANNSKRYLIHYTHNFMIFM